MHKKRIPAEAGTLRFAIYLSSENVYNDANIEKKRNLFSSAFKDL